MLLEKLKEKIIFLPATLIMSTQVHCDVYDIDDDATMKLQELVDKNVDVSFVHFLDVYEVHTDFGFFIESDYKEKEGGQDLLARYLREAAHSLCYMVKDQLPSHTNCEIYLRCLRGQDRQSNVDVFVVHCFFAYTIKEPNSC